MKLTTKIEFKDIVGALLLALTGFLTFSVLIKSLVGFNPYPIFLILFFVSALLFSLSKLYSSVVFPYRLRSFPLFILIFYVFTHLTAWVSGFIQNGPIAATLGLIEYSVYSFIVLLLMTVRFQTKTLQKIIIFNCNFALIVGGLGLYQFLFDPLLFGIYLNTDYEYFDSWGVKRVNSIMGSIQVYSAYMLFSILAIVNFRPFGAFTNFIYMVLILALGSLGGSQLFFVFGPFLIFFYLYRMIGNYFYIFFAFLLFSAIFLFSTLPIDFTEFSTFKRFSDLMSGGGELLVKLNESRLSIWLQTVQDSNFFSGNGFGSASILVSGSERYNTESFIFSAYYAGGFQLAIFYSVFFLILPFYVSKDRGWLLASINSVVYFSYALTVHVFFGILLILPWIILLKCCSISVQDTEMSRSLKSFS